MRHRLAASLTAAVLVAGCGDEDKRAEPEQVTAAGGTVSARYDLSEDLVDPAQKSLVDTLGSQLLTQQAEGDVAAEASTYDRIGQLLGLAVATKEAGGQDGEAGEREESIATYMCADVSCHENVRIAHPLAPDEFRTNVDFRIDNTALRMR